MKLYATYNGEETKYIVNRFLNGQQLYDRKNNKIELTLDEILEIINSRCTAAKAIKLIHHDLFINHFHIFNSSHEKMLKQWSYGVICSLHNFKGMLTADFISNEWKHDVKLKLITGCCTQYSQNLNEILSFVGKEYHQYFFENLCSFSSSFHQIEKMIKGFGKEKTEQLFLEYAVKELPKQTDTAQMFKIKTFINYFFVDMIEPSYSYKKTTPLKIAKFFHDSPERKEKITQLYEAFKQLQIKNKDFYDVSRNFIQELPVDETFKTEAQKNFLKITAEKIEKIMEAEKIGMADAVQYVIYNLTNGTVNMGEELYNQINAYDIMKKLSA